MILDRNLDLHERMKNAKDDENVGKYKTFLLCAIKKNTIYFGVYNICRSKINGYSSTKAGKRKWMYTGIRILHYKVDCNKLMIYTVTLKNPPKN